MASLCWIGQQAVGYERCSKGRRRDRVPPNERMNRSARSRARLPLLYLVARPVILGVRVLADQDHSLNYTIGLVLDGSFGERLLQVAATMHVWALDSALNRAVAERYWAANSDKTPERGITLFKQSGGFHSPEDVVPILDNIELHHGQDSHTPPVSTLEIFGCTARGPVIDALGVAGYVVTEASEDRLLATRADREPASDV